MSDVRRILGANLRRERKRAGLTQEQLSAATGLPRATITRIEKGYREPRVSTLLSIAAALDAPLVCLLTDLPGSDDAPPASAL